MSPESIGAALSCVQSDLLDTLEERNLLRNQNVHSHQRSQSQMRGFLSSTTKFMIATVISSAIISYIAINASLKSPDVSRWMLNTPSPGRLLTSSRTESIHRKDEPFSLGYHIDEDDLTTAEAKQALELADRFWKTGREHRAKQLYEHATHLCPESPDVWFRLGQFMEVYEKDLVEAESMYKRALMHNPSHSSALLSIKRTDRQLEEIYSRIYRRIDEKRDEIARIPHNDPALRRAKRESYYLHIYHTNAIEGNSLSLIQTRTILETGYVVPGKTVKEHTEVLGLNDALGFINATLVNNQRPLELQDLLEIHKRVLGYTDPHQAGIFRTSQVFIANHVPPPPDLIDIEMSRFFEWLGSDSANNLHPIELAGLAHYWLVHIHPFIDGNGRTGRLLMNLILMQNGFPPVTISFSDRSAYYEYLQLGNEGDIKPFLRFIADCTERTLDTYLEYTSKTIPTAGRKGKLKIESLFENLIPISYEISVSKTHQPEFEDLVTRDDIKDPHNLNCPFNEEFCDA